jgi:hypothetical protein
MRSLREDIQFFARRYGLRQGVETAAVIKAARAVLPDVLPEVLHSDVHVEAYRDGALFITAPSGSSVATVYQYRQPLLQALKTKLGRAVVARVVVRARLQ